MTRQGFLVLSRRTGEGICIGDDESPYRGFIRLNAINDNTARIALLFPKNVRILRDEKLTPDERVEWLARCA